MLSDLTVRHVATSRVGEVDFENLRFGYVFSDHMFSMYFEEGQWTRPEIVPYAPITLEPGTAMLHYGQSVFDGLKAFRGTDGAARIFRPAANEARLRNSAERLCMPPIPTGMFTRVIEKLVELDHAWIPHTEGHALYVRPLLIGTEAHLDVRPDTTYRFLIMTAPVGSYFSQGGGGVSLKAEDQYTRAAAIGGLGFAKTAANYAASMQATQRAREDGYDQVLWLDSNEHRYVEEVGAMNIFFKSNGAVITPPLSGSILPGVTRDSVITLLRDRGIPVEERPIAVDEVMRGIQDGSMEEVFGAGTAAVISPVGKIDYREQSAQLKNVPGPLTRELYDEIIGIQTGRIPDRHGWNTLVPLPTEAEPAAPLTTSTG